MPIGVYVRTKKACKNIRDATRSPERVEKMKNSLCKHHIYMDGNDNNILMLTRPKHKSLHSRAYEYLIKINKVDNYIKWFDEKYKM